MGKVSKQNTGVGGNSVPSTPDDFLSQYVTSKPAFNDVQVAEDTRVGNFNPKDYEYVNDPREESAADVQGAHQPLADQVIRSAKQFGANVLGSIATSALNSADLKGTFDILAGKQTDFNSKIFGVSTKDIMDWSQNVAQNNKIYENSAGNFDPSDTGWWSNQLASAGTGVGMAAYALGETAAVTAATEGLGAVPELFDQVKKFPQLLRMMKAAKTAEEAVEVANLASKLKRTATTYAIMNRLGESKMEAQQTYQDAYDELRSIKNIDGTRKYTDDEAQKAAAAGARRDFIWNMPLMALDILTYRSMVFNPLSGAGEGAIEKGLSNVAGRLAQKGFMGRAAGWALPHLVGSASEGLEEGLQEIGSNEGKHYARVMAGLDDKSSFFTRLGQDVTSDDFWNNFAGGVIGSPIIGGTMKLFNKASNGRAQRRLSDLHQDFVSNVGQMDSVIGDTIRRYEESGNTEMAQVLRRNFGANKALSALYLDALKGSGAAFDSYKNFLTQTLEEVKNGKTDSLNDLGFHNPTGTQVNQISNEFQTYLDDANRMERIFNQVSNQHERQFIAPIAQQMFSVETRRDKQVELDNKIEALKPNVFGYSALSDQGRSLHDLNYRLQALSKERDRLEAEKAKTLNPSERKNIEDVLIGVEKNIDTARDMVKDINSDETYTKDLRDADASILDTPIKDEQYYNAIRNSVANASQINLESRDLALWNNKAYKDEQSILSIINSRTIEQLQDMEQDLEARGKMNDKIKEAIKGKRNRLLTQQAIRQEDGRSDDAANPVVTSPGVEQAEDSNLNRAMPVDTPTVTEDIQANHEENEPPLFDFEEGGVQGTTESTPVNPTVPLDPQANVTGQIGNSDLFGEAMNDIINVTNEQVGNNSTEAVINGKEVTKVEIPNFSEIFNDGAGRVQVLYDGEKVPYTTFDITLDPDNMVANLGSIKAKAIDTSLDAAVLIKLGNELAQKGYTLYIPIMKNVLIGKELSDNKYVVPEGKDYKFTPKQNPSDNSSNFSSEIISLSPVIVKDNLNNEQRQRLGNAVQILLQDIANPSFEDLVRAAIKQSNTKTAEQTFNLLTKGWEVTGHDPIDYRSVYRKVFEDPMGTIASLLGELAMPNEVTEPQEVSQTEELTQDTVDDAINQSQEPNDFTPEGIPVYNYTGHVTEEVAKKFAFLSVPYTETITKKADGTVTIARENIEGELNQGDYVDSLRLLDPNMYVAGTPMQVMIPSNYLDIKVGVINDDGTKGTAIPFGQYVAQRNLTPNDQEYKDKIPMIIYNNGKTNERGLAFVHDVQWYNPFNFLQSKPGEMEAAIKSTREMREEVLAAKGNPVGITITSKRETTFDGLKIPAGHHITLREANPNTTIAVAKSIDTLTIDGKNIAFEDQLMNQKPFSTFMGYDVRQTGTRDGKAMYTAFPVTQPNLSELTKSSVNLALKVYLNAKNNGVTNDDRLLFDRVHRQILTTSDIDIKTNKGIAEYLKQFFHVVNTEGVNSVADAEAYLKGQGKPEGYRYITFSSNGVMYFGTLGVPMSPKNNGFFANPNPGKDAEASFKRANDALANMVKSNFFGNHYQQHIHFGSLNRNKPVIQFDAQGNPVSTKSYTDFLLDNLLTNIRSINIGTDGKPNYVTNVQPIITYESNSKLQKDSRPETTEEIKKEVVPSNTQVDQRAEVNIGVTEGNPEDAKANLDTLRKDQEDLIKQAKNELGLDYLNEDDIDLDEYDLAPIIMTEAQREVIAESIQRIAGLNPQQQYELIDFMYNQVASMIEVGNKEGVSKDQVYKKVKESFESVVKPLRQTYVDKVKQLKSMLDIDKTSPHAKDMKLAITSYNRSIERINDIQANYSLMEEETAQWVEKYTNIEKGKLQDQLETDEDSIENDSKEDYGDLADGSKDREKEFGTDTLTENPDSKLTYAMRRFLGSIRQVDREGKPATGFLRLPTYVGSDTVATTVRDLLADVPSSFDTMIAKLENSVPAHPWLRELIDRLQATNKERQNQFVTVMSNHRLSMKFSMISYDRKSGTWTSKVYNTFQSGLAAQLGISWASNFIASDLVKMVNEVYTLDIQRAQELVDEYQSWIGGDMKEIKAPIDSIKASTQMVSKKTPFVYATPTGELLEEVSLLKEGEKKKYSFRNIKYQITKDANGYRINFFNTANSVQPKNAKEWLKKIGIDLSENGYNELMTKGLYHNYERVVGDALFTSGNGLFKILANALSRGIHSTNKDLVTGDGNPLSESVVKSLANLESNFNTSVNSPNGRDGGKSIFGFTAPKYITDRTRDLKTPDSDVVKGLSSASFSKNSMWLDLILNSDKFKSQFEVSHIGLTAMKEMGKKVYKDNSITKLADADHELTKLIMFWDMKQGNVTYNNQRTSYGDTGIDMRMATMFVPTMSDKSNMMLLKTAVLDMEDKHFGLRHNNMPKIGEAAIKALYEQTVRPELVRMIQHSRLGGKTNIKSYDAGAKMFLMVPNMNNIMYNQDLRLIDAIANGVEKFDLSFIESRKDLMDKIYHELEETMEALADAKIKSWDSAGFIERNSDGDMTSMKFIDKNYAEKFTGSTEEKVTKAAIDFETNSMIANANAFMLYAGDPAMYYKSKAEDYIIQSKDSFVNVGKRLALLIAPGTTIANSENEKYIQLFLADRESLPEIPFLKFATRVNDGKEITDAEIEILQGNDKAKKKDVVKRYPKSAGYFAIEGADAQEYTTWKEHLSLLERLGKTNDSIFDVTPEEIREARELFSSWEDGKRGTLTSKQEKLIGKVLQPMKPVYTGQIYDASQDAMRVMYIKSSSFPLIPQLTSGLEIDELRKSMEEVERKSGKSVRASYQTANKVGAVNNAIKIWNQDGTINKEAIDPKVLMPVELDTERSNIDDFLKTSALVLDRKNFRIQQDVPFKSGKKLEDKITLGTQLMKILFGNGVIDQLGFTLDGKEYTGKELHREYNKAFDDLIKSKKDQLYDELGLDSTGKPIDAKKSTAKLQRILKDEAEGRGYPIQDIEGLNLDKDGNFITPLWSSANSNRYESMLNSIVTNRLVKIKFPGNSYVVGSEEGFKFKENLEGVDQSKIVWTSAWNGKGLQGSFKKNGTIEKAQVLAASKFRDNEGKLVDLLTKIDGEYKYVTQTDKGFKLKEGMFDADLLSLTSFRIPTSGHVSAAQVEIAGFLPAENADLMIVPRNFTKQMGLDFDVDKQNTYQLWHHQDKDGKFKVLTQEVITSILNDVKGALNDDTASGRLMEAIFGDELPDFTAEEIAEDAKLKSVNAKLQEKLLQNKIVNIHKAVLTHPSDVIQSKINGILSTDYAEAQADIIDSLINKENQTNVFTPLSSEYQKMKMGLGAAGKVGTGAYSLDVVFHSLVQQAKSLGNSLRLTQEVIDELGNSNLINKRFRFGTQVSSGELGTEMTIDGSRSISEVLAELQNVALDNEKLQVMGRVGLNDLTIDVSKVFALLGFDKGTDEGKSSVQFLFLSQPIIRDYVFMMKNLSSNMAEFSSDKEAEVVSRLLNKYFPEDKEGLKWAQLTADENYQEELSNRMNTKEMITALETDKPDGELQMAILNRFLELKEYGVAIKAIQVGINTDAKGLGKSFFDVIDKKQAINKLGGYNRLVRNASKLIGDYASIADMTDEEYENFIKQGYTDIGYYLVKPTSLTGSFNVHAITSAYNLWSKHLPYDTTIANAIYDEVSEVVSSDGDNSSLVDSKAVILKQDVFQAFKKFFSANPSNGVIDNGDNPMGERKRLYIDEEGRKSLASYLKEVRSLEGNKVVNNYIKTNKLINRFEFDIQKNGTPSLIKFNNAVGEDFDEQYLYNSLSSLLSANEDLPDFNGKKYNTSMLAQDLIAYSYLGNATQEAIQFTKYIPVVYSNLVGYSQFMRDASRRLVEDPSIFGIKRKNPDSFNFDSDFTIQFVQHNPERVKFKLQAKALKDKIMMVNEGKGYATMPVGEITSFSIKIGPEENLPKYVSIYDNSIDKGEKKFRLFIHEGNNVYKRIPVLGTFGMDEYNPITSVADSLVNGRAKAVVTPSNAKFFNQPDVKNDIYGINTGNVKTVLENIVLANISGFSDLARELAPYTSGITIKFADLASYGLAGERNVKISKDIASDKELLTKIILHEVIHTLTVYQIDPYIAEEGGQYVVDPMAPSYVNRLVRLYNVARNAIGKDRIETLRSKLQSQENLNRSLSLANKQNAPAIKSKIANSALTEEEGTIVYGVYNIREFMAMAMTEPEFQREMAKYEFGNTGKTLWDKFKEIINSILQGLGVNYKENSVTAQAINATFELISDKNVKVGEKITPQQSQFNEIAEAAFGGFDEFISEEDLNLLNPDVDLESGGETEMTLYPLIPNLNENNCY